MSLAVARMLDHCRKLLAADQRAYVDPDTLAMARFIVDTLGWPLPRGFDTPRVVETPDGPVVMVADLDCGAPVEAIGFGAELIRVALTAREKMT